MDTDLLYQKETQSIIAAFYEVYNALGYGFLEKVYQNALFQELKRRGFQCEAQRHIEVYFKGCKVGDYFRFKDKVAFQKDCIVLNKNILCQKKGIYVVCLVIN